jgi:hypothetical protein
MVDNKTQEIRAQDSETYSDMLELADELPDSSPRFVLLSYPLTLVSLRPPISYRQIVCRICGPGFKELC